MLLRSFCFGPKRLRLQFCRRRNGEKYLAPSSTLTQKVLNRSRSSSLFLLYFSQLRKTHFGCCICWFIFLIYCGIFSRTKWVMAMATGEHRVWDILASNADEFQSELFAKGKQTHFCWATKLFSGSLTAFRKRVCSSGYDADLKCDAQMIVDVNVCVSLFTILPFHVGDNTRI